MSDLNPGQWTAIVLAGWCALSVLVAAAMCLVINRLKKKGEKK